MHRQSTIRRFISFGVVTLIGMVLFTGVAAAAPASRDSKGDAARGNAGQTSATKDCDGTHHSKTGHGANDADPHAYNETCDGSPSGNGVGDGEAKGKPCAGCVGNADDKNPPGQAPDGPTDHNAGYECDRNQGVGKTNPAHTGCTSDPAPAPVDNGGSTPSGNGNGNGANNGGGNTPPAHTPACPHGTAADMNDSSNCTPHSTPTASPTSVLSSTVSNPQSTPDAVIGSAISAARGENVPAAARPAEVLGLSLTSGSKAAAPRSGRPTEVLGVQISRDSASLAATGATTIPLLIMGIALCLAGVCLTSVKRSTR